MVYYNGNKVGSKNFVVEKVDFIVIFGKVQGVINVPVIFGVLLGIMKGKSRKFYSSRRNSG